VNAASGAINNATSAIPQRGVLRRSRTIALKRYTVIGVMPRGFRFPIGIESEYLMPIHPLDPIAMQNRGAHFLRAVGRLRPGMTPAQASAEAARSG
jgi:hypothetical protein